MKTELDYAKDMLTVVEAAKGEIGADKTIAFLSGIFIGEILKKGGNLADAKVLLDQSFDVFKKEKAKEAGGG